MVLSKSAVTPQALSLPSGEASISGMGESFQPLLTTGAASMSVPFIARQAGTATSEAVEKFPDEVCGWWYFRTRLEGVEPTVPKGASFGGRRMDIQVNNDVAVAFGNSVFPSRMLFFESTFFFLDFRLCWSIQKGR